MHWRPTGRRPITHHGASQNTTKSEETTNGMTVSLQPRRGAPAQNPYQTRPRHLKPPFYFLLFSFTLKPKRVTHNTGGISFGAVHTAVCAEKYSAASSFFLKSSTPRHHQLLRYRAPTPSLLLRYHAPTPPGLEHISTMKGHANLGLSTTPTRKRQESIPTGGSRFRFNSSHSNA